MKKIFLFLAIILSVKALHAEIDQRLQVHENFTVSLNESFSMSAFLFESWRDDISDHYYYESMVGCIYKTPLDWVLLGPLYKQSYMQSLSGDWRSEKAPNFFIILNHVFKHVLPLPVGVFNLSRHEYRFIKDQNHYRMRNFFSVYLPSIFLMPYGAWELFYSGLEERFNYTHVQFGVREKFFDHVMPSLYYRIGFTNDGKKFRNTDNTLGVEISFMY